MGKSTVSMAIFNSKLLVYQKVYCLTVIISAINFVILSQLHIQERTLSIAVGVESNERVVCSM